MRRKTVVAMIVVLVALGATLSAGAGNGVPINPAAANPTTLSILGDVPYSAGQLAAFPAWIDAIDSEPSVDRIVHLGDIKSGGTRCDDAYYETCSVCSRASRTRWCTRRVTTSGRTVTG